MQAKITIISILSIVSLLCMLILCLLCLPVQSITLHVYVCMSTVSTHTTVSKYYSHTTTAYPKYPTWIRVTSSPLSGNKEMYLLNLVILDSSIHINVSRMPWLRLGNMVLFSQLEWPTVGIKLFSALGRYRSLLPPISSLFTGASMIMLYSVMQYIYQRSG